MRGGRLPYLWQLKEHQKNGLLDHLIDAYGLAADEPDLGTALFAVASLMAGENLDESMDGLLEDVEGTLLEAYHI